MSRALAVASLAVAIAACGVNVRLGALPGDGGAEDASAIDARSEGSSSDAFDAPGPALDARGDAVGDSGIDSESDTGGDTGASDAAADGSCDAASDPSNCGVCGHSCLGGACVAGACQPVVLLAPGGTVYAIAQDATNVYFLDDVAGVTLGSIGKDGTGPATLHTSAGAPRGLVVDGSTIYFVDKTSATPTAPGLEIAAIDVSGSPATFRDVATPASTASIYEARGIVTDATWVYVSTPTVVLRSAKTGGAASPFAAPFTLAYGLAVDTTTLYVADQGAGSVDFSATVAAGSLTVLGSAGTPSGLFEDAVNVYWAGETGVWFAPRGGGAVTPLVTGVSGVPSLTVDSARAYWIQGALIVSAPKLGGATTTLAQFGTDELGQIIGDATAVYFVDATQGQIVKLAK